MNKQNEYAIELLKENLEYWEANEDFLDKHNKTKIPKLQKAIDLLQAEVIAEGKVTDNMGYHFVGSWGAAQGFDKYMGQVIIVNVIKTGDSNPK